MPICICGRSASCGYHNSPVRFCGKCRKPGMTNIVSPRCMKEGCDIFASFSLPGERPLFCKKHSEPGMIHVNGRSCNKCFRRAYYNFEGQKNPLFCKFHSESQMIRWYSASKASSSSKAQIFYTNVKLNPDGTVADWGISHKVNLK
jgi:hypothetical protein